MRPKTPELREKLEGLIRYYGNNATRMHYDEYLRLGYGIGSGRRPPFAGATSVVVERQLGVTRFDRRWSLWPNHLASLATPNSPGLTSSLVGFVQRSKTHQPISIWRGQSAMLGEWPIVHRRQSPMTSVRAWKTPDWNCWLCFVPSTA